MGKCFNKNVSKIKILSTYDKSTINILISVLNQQGVKSHYLEKYGEFVLEIKFSDLQKAIQVASYCIEKKKLEVNCWSAPYWKQYAPKFWDERNADIKEM